MSDELEYLRTIRPTVPPPSDEVRRQALAVLGQLMDDAAAGPGAASAPRGRRRRPRPSFGVAMSALATVGACLIAVAAVVLLHHGPSRHASARRSAAGTIILGRIVSSTGSLLAGYSPAYAVELVARRMPAGDLTRHGLEAPAALYVRLARALGVSTHRSTCQIDPVARLVLEEIPCQVVRQRAIQARQPYANALLQTRVSARTRSYLLAQRAELPGVEVVRVYRRTAADVPGSGLLKQYAPELGAGDTVRTAIHPRLQRVGERALARAITANPPADGGAFVAMDPETGAIVAIGSLSRGHVAAGTDRAVALAGPVGTTFAPITALAAMQSGTWHVDQSYDDTGQFCVPGSTRCLYNSGHAAYDVVNMVHALQVSDDVFFDNLGALLNANPLSHPTGGALQHWARAFGLGQPTGIDLPGEAAGTLPSPAQLEQLYREELECEHATGPYAGGEKHPASQGGCGIAPTPDWTVGNNIDTAVGQGDDQVTPVQLAVAYGALANRGSLVTPHVATAIDRHDGTVLRQIQPAPRRHLALDPADLNAVRAGLRAAASQPGGTSTDVMGSFPEPVYGKTGTAQSISNGALTDSAWYACFVPASATNRPIVVVVTVEKGGFGDVAAAPVAREILSQWFFGRPGRWTTGTSTTL